MNTNIKTKKLIINAILLAIGAILHQITPALGLPMQPDFALAMLIIIMIINKGEYKTSLIAAIITGIFTALSTKFPNGQLPNMIDKIVTMNLIYILLMIIKGINLNIAEVKAKSIVIAIILGVGTLVSGTTFLISALIIAGLPVGFTTLFLTIVVPTVFINSIAGMFLYEIVTVTLKRVILN